MRTVLYTSFALLVVIIQYLLFNSLLLYLQETIEKTIGKIFQSNKRASSRTRRRWSIFLIEICLTTLSLSFREFVPIYVTFGENKSTQKRGQT
jgi:hypothetical protein